jgi:hypothetical protein
VIAGTYSVVVTDAHGCTANAEATVTEPGQLQVSATKVDVLCHGASTGSIDISVTGGVPPYTYAWSNGATSEDLSGLAAGGYSVTVTDANSATAGTTVTITEPPPASSPEAPTDLAAATLDAYRIQLTWTDASTTESGFQIERSITGEEGAFVTLASVAADITTYLDAGVSGMTSYCYRVRASASCAAPSEFSSVACVTSPAEPCAALDVTTAGGSEGGYVLLPDDPSLKLSAFTLELWMRRDGAGIGTSTGNGGIADAIPLIARGRSEDDSPAHNTNYVLAIRQSDGVLCADFEEGAAGTSPGVSHPVAGSTAIDFGVWHHVAATYDGATWNLYLDGNLEATLAVNEPASAASDARVAFASALDSNGAAAGYFDGAIDEVRIWSYARSASEIQGALRQTTPMPTPSLLGRWGFEESFGTTAFNTAAPVHGTIVGAAGTLWDRVSCGTWVTAVAEQPVIRAVSFARVAPNPTRGATRFEFALPRAAQVELEIHDVLGRRVATIARGAFEGGVHRLAWNGATETGGPAPNGMYYARFRSGATVTTKAFVMLR